MKNNKIVVITVVQNIMWDDMIQKINRFSRFSNEETSVLHNEMRYTTKFSPKKLRGTFQSVL